jgi:putative redox protein
MEMEHTWKATAVLKGAVTFEITARSGHSVLVDSDEATGGDNSGFRPLEQLLASDAGCAGIVVTGLLRRMRQEVTDYRINVEATRAETHPKVFTEIVVEHEIRGKGLSMASVKQSIALAAGKYCPVVLMLAKSVPTIHRYRVIDVETDAEETGGVEPAS